MFSQIIQFFIDTIYWLANIVPLPAFVFLSSLIEEIIAPIPSPFVMTLTGSIAAVQGVGWVYAVILIAIGALGKTIGGLALYVIFDKGEDIILRRFGKFLKISSRDIELVGKRLSKGWKDGVAIFLLYAVPITPTSLVSAVCGLIKTNIRTFLIAMFCGSIVRNMFYFYLGFTGVEILELINNNIGEWERAGYILILIAIVAIFISIYFHRRKNTI